MNKITTEISSLESNNTHVMDNINWLVTKDVQTKQLEVSVIVENKEGYVVLNLDEETWETLKEDVDEMIYEMYFGGRDG